MCVTKYTRVQCVLCTLQIRPTLIGKDFNITDEKSGIVFAIFYVSNSHTNLGLAMFDVRGVMEGVN